MFTALLLAISLWEQVHTSTDVSWLEKTATLSYAAPSLPSHQSAKEYRSQAYARLGELGTPESLQAVDRIEAAAKKWRPGDETFQAGVVPHPGWHMSDSFFTPNIKTELEGVTYAVFSDYLFGDMDLLLVSGKNGAWSRPHLIPMKIYRGMHDLALAPAGHGKLALTFIQDAPPKRAIMEGTQDAGEVSPKLGPRSETIDIAAVLRDTDHDGLTDIEEERLGLSPKNPDSDGDGIRDGDDTAPDFAPAATNEDAVILQKAFFATFGISGSRFTLFSARSERIQPWGSMAWVIYEKQPNVYGAVGVTWKITEHTATSASVDLTDGEGPMAAGGITVKLEKKNGAWYVVSVQTTWIA